MFRKILLLLGCIYQYSIVHASPFVVRENSAGQLQYYDSKSNQNVDLNTVLKEYGYENAPLVTENNLKRYAEYYSCSNEYTLLCDSRFLAPIKSIIWKIKFSLIENKDLNPEIKELNQFCELIKEEKNIELKNFLIKILFQKNGLHALYSEMKNYENLFPKIKNTSLNFRLNELCLNFNRMLDQIDPDNKFDRFIEMNKE